MKAHRAMNQLEALASDLDALEQDLSQVDTFVKSGNLMVDAVLNSKLSLARQKDIALDCAAVCRSSCLSAMWTCASSWGTCWTTPWRPVRKFRLRHGFSGSIAL